jgi:hypothetical protein
VLYSFIMDPTQQPPPPSFYPEFHGWNAYPPFGQSIFNFGRIGGGYSNPIRSFDQMSGPTANLALMGNLAQAQSAPTGHFDRGGSVSQTKGKVTLTPQEVAFCKRLGINLITFARHKLQVAGQ